MSDKENMLEDLTFEGRTGSLEQRIYDSLTLEPDGEQINKDLWLHRVTKAVTCLALELKMQRSN